MAKTNQLQFRISNIDFFRFVFTLIIIYFHILHSNIFANPILKDNAFLLNLKSMCKYSSVIVEFFFIISGFFFFYEIEKKLQSETFLEFTYKKFARLWPVLAFSIVICVLFFKYNKQIAFLNLFFLQCSGLVLKYGGITWYVSPLFLILIFYYMLFRTFERRKVEVFIFILIYFACAVNINATKGGFGRETINTFLSLGMLRGCFGIGVGYFIAKIYEKYKSRTVAMVASGNRYVKFILASICEVGLLALLVKFMVFNIKTKISNHLIFVILFIFLFVLFLLQNGILSRVASHKIFSLLGKGTYSVYVMQQTCFYILQRTFWTHTNFILAHPVLVVSLSVILCYCIGGGVLYN